MNIIELNNIQYSIKNSDNKEAIIIDDVNLKLKEKEIVTLLGRSGSGKSTLLRIIAGLIEPTKGEVVYDRKNQNTAMIFQTFALFPWLNVWENIEVALKPLKLSNKEMISRINKVIEITGLLGHQLAYPRELSGGMKQRVGFARALATNATILLMDEPFSALDILTAQTMRTDFLTIWGDDKISIKTVILVTHNIEEAVLLSDRIQIFSSNPGKIIDEVIIDLPHPRDRLDLQFKKIVEEIYSLMISHLSENDHNLKSNKKTEKIPNVIFTQIENFLQIIRSEPYNGNVSIAKLSVDMNFEISDLLHIIEDLKTLKFIDIKQDDIHITPPGIIFLDSCGNNRKKILAEHIIQYIPLLASLRRELKIKNNMEIEDFSIKLKNHFLHEQINRILQATISWGRYSGLFSYNDDSKVFYL